MDPKINRKIVAGVIRPEVEMKIRLCWLVRDKDTVVLVG